MKFILFIFLASLSMFGQTASGLAVVVSDGPSYDDWTISAKTNGNDTYICQAKKDQPTQATIVQSAISNANPGVVTASGHGIMAIASPTVTITGGTGNWAAFNGTWKVTYINSTTFSIPVNTTSFGAVSGTIVIKTTAPLETNPVWRVSKSSTDGTNYIGSVVAVGGYNNRCSDYLTLSYQ